MPAIAKHDSVRARRNKASTATELVVRDPDTVEIPEMPPHYKMVKGTDEDGNKIETRVEQEWHPEAVAVWNEAWASPMADEFLPGDYAGIRRLAVLEHQFWETFERGATTGLAMMADALARISKRYGLDPAARRSLQWTVAQTAESVARTANMRRPVDAEADAEEDIPDAEVVQAEMDALYD
jgi:hypothetical protein